MSDVEGGGGGWSLSELVGLAELMGPVEPVGPVGPVDVHTDHCRLGRLRAGTWEWAWAFDILVEHMESTLHSEHEERFRGLALHDVRVRNKRSRVQL